MKVFNRGINLYYEIGFSEHSFSELDIKIVITQLNSDLLKIIPYERDNLLVKHNFRCHDSRGNILPYRTILIPILKNTSVFGKGYTQYFLQTDKIDTAIIEYTVKVGAREGNQHSGHSGFAYGYLDEKFGLLLGRNILLAPEAKIFDVTVKFDFPETRKVITSWKLKDSLYYPTLGRNPIESLLLEPIGIGDFSAKSKMIHETNVVVYIHEEIPDTVKQKIFRNVFTTYEFLADIFQKPLGNEYFILFTPKTKGNNLIYVQSWGTGQGMDMPAITVYRWQKFTQNLIRAWIEDAPYRIEYKYAEDLWLVDGLKYFLSAKILDKLGLQDYNIFLEGLSRDYLFALSSGLNMIDLGSVFTSKAPKGINPSRLLQVKAPLLLDYIDRMIRLETGEKVNILDVLRLQAAKNNKVKFKDCVEKIIGYKIDEWYNEPFFKTQRPIPIDLCALTPLSSMESKEYVINKEKYDVTILFTGESRGFIEQCGCKVNQSGGIARRATFINSERKRNPNLLLIDLGDAFPIEKNESTLNKLTELEFDIFLQCMELMKYDFSVIGASELMYSPDYFLKKTSNLNFPYLSANIRFPQYKQQTLRKSYKILETQGIKIAFLGLSQNIYHEQFDYVYQDNVLSVIFEDPLTVAKLMVPHLRQQADIVCVVGRLSPKMLRKLVETVPDIDLIFSSYPRAVINNWDFQHDHSTHAMASYHTHDQNGKLNNTAILYSHSGRYGISKVDLKLNAQKRIIASKPEDFYLDESVPDDHRVRRLLNNFYKTLLARRDVVGKAYKIITSWDDNKIQNSSFAGVQTCLLCHENQYNQWKYTPHASAFKTLLERQRSSAPKCIACHVTGLGYESGYKVGDINSLFVNVQCEMCHGPGNLHVEAPSRTNIIKSPTQKDCVQCHDSEHSDMNNENFLEYYKKVIH
jgi:hypothetical protein